MQTRFHSRALVVACSALAATIAPAQTWTTVNHRPPAAVGLCLLLTDGGVMCQSGAAWYKLSADSSGSYLNGSWTTLASLPSGYNPDDFASAVLADGRLVIVGGEYNNNQFALTNLGAIYNPATNTWTSLTPPTTGSPNYFQCIGDAPATVLSDGRLIIGSKLFQNLAILDPATLTWSLVSETGKTDAFNSEEGWTLLPDGSFFTVDVHNAPASERFVLTGSTTGVWVPSGVTLHDLHTPTTSSPETAPGCPTYDPPGEMGPLLLLPSGNVFAVGADGFTGIYTPPAAGSTTAPGAWAAGPTMPAGLDVEDGPGAVLPSGHVLFGGSPGASGTGLQYFEFDGVNLNSVPAPAHASSDATYYTSLLLLPTGQVMFVDGTNTVQLYTPAASPTYNPAWAPTISTVPSSLTNGTTYTITGTQFNGLNQGSAFGDEQQNSTNYPLVRITNTGTGHVFYAKTHNHSSMGVATGNTVVSTEFDVPVNIDAGASAIQVVANGIPSAGVAVTVISNVVNSTTTTASSSPNPSVLGQAVTYTSTTTSSGGVPVGTVTFTEGATVWASNVTVNGSGQASFSTTSLGLGSHTITATFTGSTGWLGSSGSAASQVVNKDNTTTAISSSANPSVFSQSVTFTATVAVSGSGSGTPTGTVTFKNGSTTLGTGTLNGSGQATFTTSTLAVGSDSITAAYGGSANYITSSSSNLSQKVNKAATTAAVTSSVNPSASGQSVTFTATVAAVAPGTATPTGTVTFVNGNKNLGTANLSGGQATFKTSTLSTGAHQITVVYGGNTDFDTSTSPVLTQTVN